MKNSLDWTALPNIKLMMQVDAGCESTTVEVDTAGIAAPTSPEEHQALLAGNSQAGDEPPSRRPQGGHYGDHSCRAYGRWEASNQELILTTTQRVEGLTPIEFIYFVIIFR